MWKSKLNSICRAPYRLPIGAQLTVLVCFISCTSLLILSVTTGVYFTSNFKSLRAEQLLIAAQLKSSQIDQTLNLLYLQSLGVTGRDGIQSALVNYIAGNDTQENWSDAKDILEKFLNSSDIFSIATLYDTQFNIVLNTTNNGTGNDVEENILESLSPLSGTAPLPASLETIGMLTDPVKNGSTYLMSMSIPIFANPSIILFDSRVYGYVTIVMSASSIRSVFNDTTALDNSLVCVTSAIYENSTEPAKYHFVFAPYGSNDALMGIKFPIVNDTFLSNAFVQGGQGSVQKANFFFSKSVALGYSPCGFTLTNWVATVFQPESVFIAPSIKLTKIIVITVVCTAVLVGLTTFPISHWAVKPIVRLQKATELIAEGRHLKSNGATSSSTPSRSSSRRSRKSFESSVSNLVVFKKDVEKTDTRNYQNSATLNSSHDSTNNDKLSDLDIQSNISSGFQSNSNLINARIPIYRRLFEDELSELTETFNVMTDALDHHYALLEHRVKARTKELEAAKIEAESANEAKTVFIANISHELRTPLNGILGMTAIAMEDTDRDTTQNSLKLIFRSGELLLHILTELLTFSKNVLKRTNLEKVDFSIIDIALQAKSIFGKIAKDQHVKFSILISPNILRSMVLWGDSNRIMQIVMNLVSNALKFTPEDGEVTVRIKLLGEYDKERSEREKFKAVYIKAGTEVGPQKDPIKNSNKESKNIVASNPVSTIKNIEESSQVSDSESADSESEAIYDNTIFQREFKNNMLTQEDGKIPGTSIDIQKTWVISMEVQDTGPGISSKLQNSVFEPFVQGDQSLSRQYGGTGLGLSICRQLSALMNGTMTLDSTVGVGSKFTFTVPLLQTREVSLNDIDATFEDEFNFNSKKNRKVKFKNTKIQDQSDSSISNKNSKTIKKEKEKLNPDRPLLQNTGTAKSSKEIITLSHLTKPFNFLLVEDNKMNQEVIKRMLKLEKIEDIDLACDGQEAIDKVKEIQKCGKHYDLIFMDIQMPNIDGYAATNIIRNELNYVYPIVALTALADEDNVKKCFESGMNGFLAKPIKRFQLRDILKEYEPLNQ